jgi:small ubiquitin-related modifier
MSGEETKTLTITVKLNDTEQKFKVKRVTPMRKVMKAFAQQRNLDVLELKFIFDGDRILPEDTPKTLEMEEDSQIDCFLQQVGGFQ